MALRAQNTADLEDICKEKKRQENAEKQQIQILILAESVEALHEFNSNY